METVDISDPALPMAINLSVAGIRTAVSANKQAALDAAQVGYCSGWINLSHSMKRQIIIKVSFSESQQDYGAF